MQELPIALIDIIPLLISERLIEVDRDLRGCTIEATGQFRSYNRHEGVKNRLVLSVFVREVNFMEEKHFKVAFNDVDFCLKILNFAETLKFRDL